MLTPVEYFNFIPFKKSLFTSYSKLSNFCSTVLFHMETRPIFFAAFPKHTLYDIFSSKSIQISWHCICFSKSCNSITYSLEILNRSIYLGARCFLSRCLQEIMVWNCWLCINKRKAHLLMSYFVNFSSFCLLMSSLLSF